MDEYLVVVIAPDREWQKKLLVAAGWNEDNNWQYVTVDKECQPKKDNDLNNDCIFILINQCQVAEQIKTHLGKVKTLDKNGIVWTHQTQENGSCPPFSSECVKKELGEKLFDCIDFSHPDDAPQQGEKAFLEFMNSFARNDITCEQRKAILQSSIDEIVKKKAESDAQTLRADILTPFIPFHLFPQLKKQLKDQLDSDKKEKESKGEWSEELQQGHKEKEENLTKEWEGIFNDCCKAINAEDDDKKNITEEKFNKLIGLKNIVTSNTDEFCNEAFETLKGNLQSGDICLANVKDTDCRNDIEEFAVNLEEIVNAIEAGEGN